MSAIVLDSSVAIAWAVSFEESAFADAAIHRVMEFGGFVPKLWWAETRNALATLDSRLAAAAQSAEVEALADGAV